MFVCYVWGGEEGWVENQLNWVSVYIYFYFQQIPRMYTLLNTMHLKSKVGNFKI